VERASLARPWLARLTVGDAPRLTALLDVWRDGLRQLGPDEMGSLQHNDPCSPRPRKRGTLHGLSAQSTRSGCIRQPPRGRRMPGYLHPFPTGQL